MSRKCSERLRNSSETNTIPLENMNYQDNILNITTPIKRTNYNSLLNETNFTTTDNYNYNNFTNGTTAKIEDTIYNNGLITW